MLAHRYREWLTAHPCAQLLDLKAVLQQMAPHVLDLQTELPAMSAVVDLVLQRLRRLSSRKGEQSPKKDGGSPIADGLVVHLSHHGRRMGDGAMVELANGLVKVLRHDRRLAGCLDQLWVHHTGISDASCGALASLITHTTLRELHVSHTEITIQGLQVLMEAAMAAGYGQRPGVPALYINAGHLLEEDVPGPTPAAVYLKLARAGAPQHGHYHHHGGGGSSPGRGRGFSPRRVNTAGVSDRGGWIGGPGRGKGSGVRGSPGRGGHARGHGAGDDAYMSPRGRHRGANGNTYPPPRGRGRGAGRGRGV